MLMGLDFYIHECVYDSIHAKINDLYIKLLCPSAPTSSFLYGKGFKTNIDYSWMSLLLPSEAGYTPEKFMVLFIYLFIYFPRYAFGSLSMNSPFVIPL